MNLSNVPKITKRSKKRVGRGHGSGRVKTSGRGTKGQKARGKIGLSFEGGIVSIIKRLPMRRGKGKNKSLKRKSIVINVKVLNLIPKNAVVDVDSLIKYKIVESTAKNADIKILGEGQLTVPLIVKLPTSKGARLKIEKAGGKIET